MELLDPAAVHSELTTLVANLDQADELVIAEARADCLMMWRVRRNQADTPQAHYQAWPWASLTRDDLMTGKEFQQAAGDGAIPLIFCPPPQEAPDRSAPSQFLDWFRVAHPEAMRVETLEQVNDLMLGVLAGAPLSLSYELAVLRGGAQGRLTLSTIPLFPRGAKRGQKRSFPVHCDASPAHGVAFAVVAQDAEAYGYHLVSVGSAQVPPGDYAISAVLLRPGRVRFDGLPVPIGPDVRSWPEIVAAIPDRIAGRRNQGVHLICLVETYGGQQQAGWRVDVAVRLLELAGLESAGPLAVSVIGYGTHSFSRYAREDDPTTVLAWAEPAQNAVPQVRSALRRLIEQSADSPGYPSAARLECALAQVAGRVTGDEGRPVLVVIGSRPPFPSRADVATGILPCPYRNDWKRALVRLGEHAGVALGCVTDDDGAEIWRFLGRDASAQPSSFDAASFAAKLGILRQDGAGVPLPIAEPPEREHAG